MILFLLCLIAADLEQLPIVAETVDEIMIMRIVDNSYDRVIFIRDAKVLATRLYIEEMHWIHSREGFELHWEDYSIARRIVTAPRVSVMVTEFDPTQAERCGPWWNMRRRMTDLRMP